MSKVKTGAGGIQRDVTKFTVALVVQFGAVVFVTTIWYEPLFAVPGYAVGAMVSVLVVAPENTPVFETGVPVALVP